MARWKASVEFLLSVIEHLFLSLTVEALQGKMCQNSLPSGGGRSLAAKISGGMGRPGEYFLVSTKLDTLCYPTVQTAPCCVPSFWHNTNVWQTDGIAIASTALAMRALRRAVKICRIYTFCCLCPHPFPISTNCTPISELSQPCVVKNLKIVPWMI